MNTKVISGIALGLVFLFGSAEVSNAQMYATGAAYSTETGVYNGVPALASYIYTGANGSYRVNVFTKEQWNNIRIAETRAMIDSNFKDQNHYYGEGRYLGETLNYIFTYSAI